MKVIFRPSIDEHVEFLSERQKQLQSNASNVVIWIFFAFNLGFVPAVLLFKDLIWAGIAIFVFNAILIIFLISWQQKRNLRKHYEEVWPQLEEFDCEIGIDEKGVGCEHAGNRNFYPWRNVRSIGEVKRMIYFDVGPTQVLVSKRGFSGEEEAKAFMQFAHTQNTSALNEQ